MWMAYRQYTPITDLMSGVQNIREQLDDMHKNALDESVYGYIQVGFDEAAEKYCIKLAEKYKEASKWCEKFLLSEIDIFKLVENFEKINLKGLLYCLKPYIEEDSITFSDSDNEEENK